MTTGIDQLPCDLLDIIYRKKHQLETADVVASIKGRQADLVTRTRSVINQMRNYGKVMGLLPEDEVAIQRCLFSLGLLDMSEFRDVMIHLEESANLMYDDDEAVYILLDYDYWLGIAPAYEHEMGNLANGTSLEVLLKRYEDMINAYFSQKPIFFPRALQYL